MRMKILANKSWAELLSQYLRHMLQFSSPLLLIQSFFGEIHLSLCHFALNLLEMINRFISPFPHDSSLWLELATRACTWRMLLCRFHIERKCIFPSPGKCLTMRNSCAQKQSAERCTKSDAVIYHSKSNWLLAKVVALDRRSGVAELCLILLPRKWKLEAGNVFRLWASLGVGSCCLQVSFCQYWRLAHKSLLAFH